MVHPDKFASASDAEKLAAQQWSTRINDAYNELKDPVRRAKLICSLMGHPVNDETSGTLNESFLMDQLIRREEISLAKEDNNQTQLTKLKEEITAEKDSYLGQIEQVLDIEEDAAKAGDIIKKVMFLQRQLADLN